MLAGEDVRWVGPLHEAADWRLTTQAIAAGQLAFLGAMLASLVWNADEPGFAAVRLNRAVALRMIVEARRHQGLTQFQRAQLVGALAALKDEAPKLSAKLLGASDAALLERWWNGAETLHQMLAPRPTELLADFDWTAGAASDALGELQANR
jgi:hypothetical protein